MGRTGNLRSRSLCVVSYLVCASIIGINAQVHLPTKHTAVDRTSFIVKFDEALLSPVSIAAVDSSDDTHAETVRAAAQELGSAAATAAARIAELARQAGIAMRVVDTYGEHTCACITRYSKMTLPYHLLHRYSR
jgi:hypothetical protein